MAFHCSGKTNAELISNLINNGIIKTKQVEKAMRAIDRGKFTSSGPYEDRPQLLGYGATISAPHMHAYALEQLHPFLYDDIPRKVLDIGAGSGYLSACMATMVGQNGLVVGIEHVKELVEKAESTIMQQYPGINRNIKFVSTDGRLGYLPDSPYDCIHVGAASDGNLEILVSQLKSPGRLFVPVENAYGDQTIMIIDKANDGTITKRHLMGVMYVPLTSIDEQLK